MTAWAGVKSTGMHSFPSVNRQIAAGLDEHTVYVSWYIDCLTVTGDSNNAPYKKHASIERVSTDWDLVLEGAKKNVFFPYGGFIMNPPI